MMASTVADNVSRPAAPLSPNLSRNPLRLRARARIIASAYIYFMGLNLSNQQIAKELGLCGSDVQAMTEQLRRGLVAKTPAVELTGEVEIDEVYVVAGHKGQPDEVAKRGGSGAAASWQARRDAARWRKTSRPFSA